MSKLITVQNEVVKVSDELYEFMESDRILLILLLALQMWLR